MQAMQSPNAVTPSCQRDQLPDLFRERGNTEERSLMIQNPVKPEECASYHSSLCEELPHRGTAGPEQPTE